MVNGQMRCIIILEDLKSKYVQGYLLEGHLEELKEEESNVVQIKKYIEEMFPRSDYSNSITWCLCFIH